MVNYDTHKQMFIYANKDKLWLVWDGQPIEIKDYYINSMDMSIGPNDPYIEFSFDLIGLTTKYIDKGKVDVSDFYDMEECKKLSKIIQRKFDKLLEKKE